MKRLTLLLTALTIVLFPFAQEMDTVAHPYDLPNALVTTRAIVQGLSLAWDSTGKVAANSMQHKDSITKYVTPYQLSQISLTPGPQGPTGGAWAIGPQGAAGSNGATGATGSAGTQGSTGATGATGLTGVAGAQGSIGNTGTTGAQGIQGAVGAAGAAGSTGAQGATGAAGSNASITLTTTGTSGVTTYNTGTGVLNVPNYANSGGTVTSIGVSSADFSVSGSPITTSGSVTLNLNTSGVIAGTYGLVTVNSKGVVTGGKRQERYSGTTDASGNYTVTFGTAYSAAPNIQANIVGGTDLQRSKITAITTTGFTVNVVTQNTTSVALVGLVVVPGTTVVSGVSIDALISEK